MTNTVSKKTKQEYAPQGWPAIAYNTIIGMDMRSSAKYGPRSYLAKADIDAASGGIVHLDTSTENDPKTGAVLSLDLQFSTLQTNNNLSRQHVFQIENRKMPNGDIIPQSVYCMGAKIYDAAIDGPDFNVQDLNVVHQAVQELNNLMRPPYSGMQGEFSPKNVLRILNKYNIDEIIGESLDKKFEGITAKGQFDFEFRDVFNRRAANDNELRMPSREFARAVIGDQGVNTLDQSVSLSDAQPRFATHAPSGVLYSASSDVKALKTKLTQFTSLTPAGPEIPGVDPQSVPELFRVEFQSARRGKEAAGEQKISRLEYFGQKTNDDPLTLARVLRTINRINLDMQNGQYPKIMTHSIKSDVHEYAYDTPPPEKGDTRVDIIRHHGNSHKKIVAGMGDQLGDCTYFEHQYTDKDGVVHKQGLMIDLGATIAPQGSEYSLAVPDISTHLDHFDDLFITHHHLDHMAGAAPYISRGMFANPEYYERAKAGDMRGKTFHGTEKQILREQNELKKNKISAELWPKFNKLEGTGFVHIRNKKTGQLAFSVQYAASATPHSADTNGFRVFAYNDNKLQFSLLKPGDFRYDHFDPADLDSDIPHAETLNKEFYSSGPEVILAEQQRMLENGDIKPEDMLDPATIKGRRDTLGIDGTNYKKPGFAPTEAVAEDNEVRIKNELYPNKMSLETMISTSDAGLRRKLRVAVRTNSHFSLGGANLEMAGNIFNKTGVDANLIDPDDGKNIQKFMDWVYRELHKIEADDDDVFEYSEYFFSECKTSEDKFDYIKMLAEDEYQDDPKFMQALCFSILSETKQSNVRYARQVAFENILEEVYDQKIMLGSIYTGRDSATFKDMVKNDKGRVKFVMTGTQGVDGESEAGLQKHIEGRGFFSGNPKNKKTAIPLKKDDYFLSISQAVIPGNEGPRHDIIRQAVSTLGVPVIEAVGDGFKHYNFASDQEEAKARKIYEGNNAFITPDIEGAMMVNKMPIYASGHGCKEDVLSLIELVQPEMVEIGHTDDIETVNEFISDMRDRGIKTPDALRENGTRHTYHMGEKPEDIENTVIGKIANGMILLKQIRPWKQQYGGYEMAERVICFDGEGGVVSDALTANEDINPESGLVITQHFGAVNREEEDRASQERAPYQRRSKTDIEGPQEDKIYAGPTMPKRGKMLPEQEDRFNEFLSELGV